MPDDLTIENVVATAELGLALDLAALERRLGADPFDPKRFPGLVIRQRGTTFLVFADGRIRLTGPKSPEDAKRRIQALTEKLDGSGVKMETRFRFWVDNLVVSSRFPGAVALDQVALALGDEKTAFDPEAFPGLVHRMSEPPIALLLFPSGRLVATGIGDLDRMRKAVWSFMSTLRERRLVPLVTATRGAGREGA